MKLSSETLTVLQNFAKLNSGIQFNSKLAIKSKQFLPEKMFWQKPH